MTRSVLLAVVFCTGCIRSAAPLGTLTSDRPGFSDSQGIIPTGRFQLESGYTYSDVPHGSYQSIGELLFRFGLAQRLELRTHLNSYALRKENSDGSDGLEDSKLGLKYLFSAKSKGLRPAVSAIAQASFPTGSDAFSQRKTIPEVKVIGSWSGNSQLSFTANGGLNWGRPNERDGFAFITAAPWMTINRSTAVFAELYSTAMKTGNASASRQVDGGITWLLKHNAQLDLRIGTSIRADSPGSFFGAGLVTRW